MTAFTATTGLLTFGWKRGKGERLVLAVPMLSYTLLIAVFASIFRATPLQELPQAIRVDAAAMIWYMVFTEMITFAGGFTFYEVRNDVFDGQFTAGLPRPVSYIRAKLCGWLGQTALRTLVFFGGGLVLGTIFSGTFLPPVRMLPVILLSAYLGAMLYGIVYASLALLEVWGPYARPAMWISQKFCFLLGGLVLPITFYPHWLQILAWLTPYPAILHVSGRLAFNPPTAMMIHGLLFQAFWLAAMTVIALLMQHLATRTIMKRGH